MASIETYGYQDQAIATSCLASSDQFESCFRLGDRAEYRIEQGIL
jgi:hypothetical protein